MEVPDPPLALPSMFGGADPIDDGSPDAKRPRLDENPTALPSLPFAPSLLSDHAGDKTASDDEADDILSKHFPRFFYGQVLKFSEVLDGNSGSATNTSGARHRPLQSGRRPSSRRIVDCADDAALSFESITVPTVVLPSKSDRLKVHSSDETQCESLPAVSGTTNSLEQIENGDTLNDESTDTENHSSLKPDGSTPSPSGSSADATKNDTINPGDGDFVLLDQLGWEDDVIWDDTPSESQRRTVFEQSIVNHDFGQTHRKRRNTTGERTGKNSTKNSIASSSMSNAITSPAAAVQKASVHPMKVSNTPDSSEPRAASAGDTPTKKPSFNVSSFVKEAPVVKAGTTKEREDEEEAKRTEAAVVIPKEIAKSMFAPKTDLLGSGQWLEEVVWDGGNTTKSPDGNPAAAAAPAGTNIPVLIDLNDPHLLPDTTIEKPVFMRPRHRIKQFSGRNRIPTWKLREMERDFESARQERLKGDLPPPNSREDPFIELANDKVYRTKEGTTATDFALKKCLGRKVPGLDHSTLARKLDLRCFAADWDERGLRTFHRPKLRKEHTPAGASKRMSEVVSTHEQRELKRPKPGRWKAQDLSTVDGTGRDDIVLAEYCEQFPLLVHNSGMCMLVRNYYKQKDASDAIPKAKFRHGTTALVGPRDASPFLGNLKAETSLQSMENNLFRAPMYCHRMSTTDFIVTRVYDEHENRDKYYVRRVPYAYTIGQVLPKLDVPAPNSKEAKNFAIKRLSVYIQRLFLCDADAVVRVEEIRQVFPTYSEANIRKRLRDVATFTRGIDTETSSRNAFDNGAWERDRCKDLPTDAALQADLTPEEVCTYESMLAAVQRIRDMGYDRDTFDVKELEEGEDEDATDAGAAGTKQRRKKFTVEDELRLAPWHLSTDFLNYVRDKCLLYITGKGEPTGCGEGFSYLRQPHRVDGAESQYSTVGAAVTKKQTPLAGSAADLRTLYLKPAKELLINKYGVDPEFLKTKDRWQVIDIVRQKSTEEALATESGNQFARGQRSSAAERQFEFTQECQRIFDQQNRSLASEEVLTSEDEDSDDSDRDGEATADTRALQEALGDKRLIAAQRSKKEKGALEKLQTMMNQDARSDAGASSATGGGRDAVDNASTVVSGATGASGRTRKLVITRHVRNKSGQLMRTRETVRNPAVIDAYLRVQAVRGVGDAGKTRRGKGKGRRGGKRGGVAGRGGSSAAADDAISVRSGHSGGGRVSPTLSVASTGTAVSAGGGAGQRCSRCGGTGHNRTNTRCPMFHDADTASNYESEVGRIVEEGVTDLEGTTMKIDMTRVGQAMQMRQDGRRMEQLTSSRRASVKRGFNDDYYYSDDDETTIIRGGTRAGKRNPEVLLNSLFQDLMTTLKRFKSSRGLDARLYFAKPVDRKVYPGYYYKIKNPIDLGAIQEKIKNNVYRSRHDFITDMRLLAQNALHFNGSGHEVYQCASEMRDFVLQDLRDHEEEMALLETTLGTLEESKASLDALKPEIDRDMEAIALWEHEHKLEVQRVAQEVEE